jgi:hypothetical protein
LLALLPLAVPATASATTLTFDRNTYSSQVGQPFDHPVRVTVKDDVGAPLADTEVTFTTQAEAITGAIPVLDATSATTDANGVAQITASGGDTDGFPALRATVGDVTKGVAVVIRRMGFVPGQQLARVVAQDHTGVTRDIRDTLRGNTWMLVDVCAGWCGPCQFFVGQFEDARTELYTRYHVRVEMASLLMEGTDHGVPSTRTDALRWKRAHGLSGNVYHAEGSRTSELFRSGFYFAGTGAPGGFLAFPTHLLVSPKGEIIDQVVGVQTAEETVARIVAASGAREFRPRPPHPTPPSKTVAPTTITATLGGQTFTQAFTGSSSVSTPLGGDLVYTADDSDLAVAYRSFGLQTPQVGTPLPASGVLGLTLTRPNQEKNQPLTTTSLPTQLFAELPEQGITLHVDTTLPASTPKQGVTAVQADLAAMRSVLRTKLEAGQFTLESGVLVDPSAEEIDALVASMWGIMVRAGFTRTAK